MQELTEEGRRVVDELAARHAMSADAVVTLLRALMAGNGMLAQFSHPELGGMGQWSQGGMIMIGDMFNNSLKYRVDQLAGELAGLVRSQALLKPVARPAPPRRAGSKASACSCPAAASPPGIGRPSSVPPHRVARRTICTTPISPIAAVWRSGRAAISRSMTRAITRSAACRSSNPATSR